ncbi:MAG: mechanosensitive ion channel, partial [Acidobacteria bacterium]|nr:mechanosensitive ion channel [Acidobacteriota bacterium]
NVIELLLNVAQSNPEILSEPAPQVLFTGFGDSALQFELRFWTAIQVHPVVRSQMVMAILQALETAGIEIPFPQRDLRVKLDDEVIERLVARQGKDQAE